MKSCYQQKLSTFPKGTSHVYLHPFFCILPPKRKTCRTPFLAENSDTPAPTSRIFFIWSWHKWWTVRTIPQKLQSNYTQIILETKYSRQPLKNSKGIPQILLGPFLNTLSQILTPFASFNVFNFLKVAFHKIYLVLS